MRFVFIAFFAALVISFAVLSIVQASAQECKEGERRLCGSGIGVCEPGRSICRNGKWVTCEGATGPISDVEICGNGLDDNCNGQIDENCFPWVSLILVGLGMFFIGIGLYYMQKQKGERITSERVGKD